MIFFVIPVVLALIFSPLARADVVGLAGTGAMGTALGQCFLKNGHNVVAWNRSPAKTATLVSDGATAVPSFTELFNHADTVIMTVVGDEDLATATALIQSASHLLEGKTIIQWTSHEPVAASNQAKLVESYGGRWIGGAMMVTPHSVCSTHGLYFLSGGNQQLFDSVNKLVAPLGTMQYFGENPGLGSLYDIVILMPMMLGLIGHFIALKVVELGGGNLEVFDGLSKNVTPMLFKELGGLATHIYRTEAFNGAVKIMPLESYVPALDMWLRYFNHIGIRTELFDVLKSWYTDMMQKHPNLKTEDCTIIAKYVDKNSPFHDEF